MKVLIADGTGFIGRTLIPFLLKKGNEVNVLTRRTMPDKENIHYYQWDVDQGFIDPRAFDGVDALINMTGANIGEKQWTVDRKNEILNSRVKPLDFLLKVMIESGNRINVLISSSAVGYYGAVTTNHVLTHNKIDGVINIILNEHFIMNEYSDKMLQFFGRKRLFPSIPAWVVKMLFHERAKCY